MHLYNRAGALCVVGLFASSCSFAPITPRVDAASIGKHEVKLQSNIGPTPSFGILYGLGDNLDLGAELEQGSLGTVWSRYSFINNPVGVSFAANAGVFVSTVDDRRSNGWYAGLLLSNQVTPKVRLAGGYRFALLDYEYSLEDQSSWFNNLDFNNPDDASENGQLEVSVSVKIKPYIELSLGGVCQYLYKNKDTTQRSEACAPQVGFSFYRL